MYDNMNAGDVRNMSTDALQNILATAGKTSELDIETLLNRVVS